MSTAGAAVPRAALRRAIQQRQPFGLTLRHRKTKVGRGKGERQGVCMRLSGASLCRGGLIASVLWCASSVAQPPNDANPPPRFRSDTVLVKPKQGVAAAQLAN